MKSMTGYASLSKVLSFKNADEEYSISVSCDMKTLNGKYNEVSLSIPPCFYPYEVKIRDIVCNRLKRGKVMLSLKIESGSLPQKVSLDESLLNGVKTALNTAGVEDASLFLSSIPFEKLFTVIPARINEEGLTPLFNLINDTTTLLIEERVREGENTKEDLKRIGVGMREECEKIKSLSVSLAEKHYENLKESMSNLLSEYAMDESRLYSEAALLASKANINEEIKRLESHIAQYESILEEEGSLSKRLEFLSQELLRETNTIASKSQVIEITKASLNLKSYIDEMREQARNIE